MPARRCQSRDGSISNSETFAVGHAATLAGFDLAAITSQIAGVQFGVSATAHDAYGNLMTGFSGPAALAGLDDSPGCAICNPVIPSASATHGALSWSAGTGTANVTAVGRNGGRHAHDQRGLGLGLAHVRGRAGCARWLCRRDDQLAEDGRNGLHGRGDGVRPVRQPQGQLHRRRDASPGRSARRRGS